MKKLIVNADDFGLSESVNQAIIDCHRRGNVSSTTMMVNMPAARHAADLARVNPKLGVGLHFCLTEGQPVTTGATLVGDDGNFHSRSALLKRIQLRRVDAAEVVAEFRAQLARLSSLGVSATHVDSHQHVHMSSWLFETLLPEINRTGLPLRLVYPPIQGAMALKRPLKFAKELVLHFLSRRFVRRLQVKSNDCLVSVHQLAASDSIGPGTYGQLLAIAGGCDVVEVMVHPYVLGEDLFALYKVDLAAHMEFFRKCEAEFKILSAESVFEGLTTHRLVSYSSL